MSPGCVGSSHRKRVDQGGDFVGKSGVRLGECAEDVLDVARFERRRNIPRLRRATVRDWVLSTDDIARLGDNSSRFYRRLFEDRSTLFGQLGCGVGARCRCVSDRSAVT